MLDLSSYCKDCAQLSLGQEKIQEMITMTENSKKKRFGHPVRVAVLAAALAACLGATAFAASPAGQEMIQEFIATYTFFTTDNGQLGMPMSADWEADMTFGLALPTMSYEERDGRKILTLDGEESDVTAAMEKDGYYELKIEGVYLIRVEADGVAIITVYDKSGGAEMTYTMDLNGSGSAQRVDIISQWEGETDENGNIVSADGETDGIQ